MLNLHWWIVLCFRLWRARPARILSPTFPIVQASGTGKTKLMYEYSKQTIERLTELKQPQDGGWGLGSKWSKVPNAWDLVSAIVEQQCRSDQIVGVVDELVKKEYWQHVWQQVCWQSGRRVLWRVRSLGR